MENVNQWYFTKEELACTPSRKCGIDANKELSYRQQAANFIQDMGQRLQVSQLCINTAIVYMHRFYVFHSFTEIHRNNLSVAALFLAAKVEEQPRKLEHVIKVAHICLHKDAPPLDVRSEGYSEKQFEVVNNESILLQTLGFMLAIEHPHTYVVKVCQLVKACKDLAQTSYFMATTSLHMTTMCLQYKPTLVACVCIHLACKWSSWKIEPCSEGKEWYYYVDKTVTLELLENLTQEFIAILENSPHRFKRKFIPQKQEASGHSQKNASDEKHHSSDKPPVVKKENPALPGPSTSFNLSQIVDKPVSVKVENSEKHPVPPQSVHSPQTPKKNKTSSHSISIDAYREKKEKERLEQKPVPTAAVEPSLQQPVVNKAQHASNDHDRAHKHAASNSLEPHSHPTKEKASKGKEQHHHHHHHQVHSSASSSSSVSKMNHHSSKKPESSHAKESKSGNMLKLSSNVSSDPVVVLERVDVKSEPREPPASESSSAAAATKLPPNPKHPVPADIAEPVSVASSPVTIKMKHHKHKTNSVRSNNNSVHPHTHKRSPSKDIKTNGSKESDSERKNAVVENHVSVKTPEVSSSKHEKREKYKTKHSYNSSKDKVVNSESTPAIKVKIRKEDINKLPEKSQKFQPSVTVESSKKPLKIKISKPPVPPEPVKTTTPLKLVITKDKSGSGSYCTSHKNERESKKRAHSPSSHEVNSKSSGEMPSKYAKLDHAHSSSHSNAKQSKSRHSSSRNTDHTTSNNVSSNKLLNQANDSTGYLNVDVENYTGQPYYGNQYYPYQVPPPPPPPATAPGYRGKTNFNLSTQLPQPSLPPPPE